MTEETLFHEALAKPAAERSAFLDAATAGKPELRAAVAALLSAHETSGNVLDQPPVDLGSADDAIPEAEASFDTLSVVKDGNGPETIIASRYTLLEKIGEGGMGEVWVAKQTEPVKRKVALKLIKKGMDSKAVLSRFEQERQALAMMDHPNIARVLDGGLTPTGQPFFVMELVNGLSLTKYCDEAKLTLQQRLKIFIPICQAVQHAHQKGIVHRDLKPANILVTLIDGNPVPKVIDFGVAKATHGKLIDELMYTQFGSIVGTLEYMAPEQAGYAGEDIDTRADIYSLGVILYELLTGLRPIDAKRLKNTALLEMIRVIKEEEPAKPSTRLSTHKSLATLAASRQTDPKRLTAMLRGDLDCVVMMCLEKNRNRRYETVNGLAADIRRFLADEPVSATPPSAGYQFRKFARRNKTALRVAASIAIVLVAATLVSAWQALRATRAEKLANDEAIRATTAERLAFERLAQVAAERDAKDLARKDAEDISKFLGNVFRSPDPKRDGREIKVAELLDAAAKELDLDLAAQPAQRAKLQSTLGATYFALGLTRQAIPLQEKARDYLLATFGLEHPNTVRGMSNLASSYFAAGRWDEALKLREEVLALRSKLRGPKHPDTLDAMTNLATSYRSAGRRDEALRMQEEVLALSRKVNGAEHPSTLVAMSNLVISYHYVGRRDEALKLQEEVLALSSKVNGAEHPNTISEMNNLASCYATAAGRQGEALKLREEVLALRRKLLGPEHPDTLKAMHNLAISCRVAGRKDEALKLCEDVLEIRRKLLGPEHPDTLEAMTNLGNSLSSVGRKDEALKLREDALKSSLKALGPEHTETLRAMNNLALSYHATGREDEALKLGEEVVALYRKVLGAEHPDTLAAMLNLAVSHRAKGNVAKADALEKEIAAAKAKAQQPAKQP